MTLQYGDERISPRIWEHVHPEPLSGCWLWGAGQSKGYARLTDVTPGGLHRLVLTVDSGISPPPSIHACHHCDTPPCVNPAHLYWGRAKANAGDHNRRHGHPNAHKTHCPQGHVLEDGNLVAWKLKRGIRECATCSRAHKAAWKERNR